MNHRKKIAPAVLALGIAVGLLAGASDSIAGSPSFTNVTRAAGISHTFLPPQPFNPGAGALPEVSAVAGGAVAEDFDGDGWIDLFVIGGGDRSTLLYMNNRDGTFTDEASDRGAGLPLFNAKGAAAADFDSDGDIDICVTRQTAPHVLLINDGRGVFHADTTMLALPPADGSSASWGDVDNDGLLDLVIGAWPSIMVDALALYRNAGDGVLVPYDFRTKPGEDRFVFSPRFADMDGDRLVDLVVVADFRNTAFYHNVGGGLFENRRNFPELFSDENGMGSAIGDYDNDGDLDWFVSNIFEQVAIDGWGITGNRLYKNDGTGAFNDATDEGGVRDGGWGWGGAFGDLDNDGDLDLYHVNGWSAYTPAASYERFNEQPARLFENLGDGRFDEIAAAAGAGDRGQGRGVILFDYDNDGDLDIFICNNVALNFFGEFLDAQPAAPTLLRNGLGTDNHWLKVTLAGSPPYHSHGIGARVYVTAGGSTQMRELHASTNYMAQGPGRIAHFGLGSAEAVEEIRVVWPTGETSTLRHARVDGLISIASPFDNAAHRWETYR